MISWETARRVAVALLMALLVAWATVRWVAAPWTIPSESMAPTLLPGDRVLVEMLSQRRRGPLPGEVILFLGPGEVVLVKRVVAGRPGGSPDAPRLPSRVGDPLEQAYFVTGDNAEESFDSRAFGPVPRSRVLGRVVFRYWPLSRAGPIRAEVRRSS